MDSSNVLDDRVLTNLVALNYLAQKAGWTDKSSEKQHASKAISDSDVKVHRSFSSRSMLHDVLDAVDRLAHPNGSKAPAESATSKQVPEYSKDTIAKVNKEILNILS